MTEVRPDSTGYRLIKGDDAVHDLRLFVEDITDSMNLRVEEAKEPVHTVEDLSKMFNVSTKTISRWRDQGLVSRRFLADGRKRSWLFALKRRSIVAQNKKRVERGERFTQISDVERDDIIDRARRSQRQGKPLEVARTVASEMHRSTEPFAIRSKLRSPNTREWQSFLISAKCCPKKIVGRCITT